MPVMKADKIEFAKINETKAPNVQRTSKDGRFVVNFCFIFIPSETWRVDSFACVETFTVAFVAIKFIESNRDDATRWHGQCIHCVASPLNFVEFIFQLWINVSEWNASTSNDTRTQTTTEVAAITSFRILRRSAGEIDLNLFLVLALIGCHLRRNCRITFLLNAQKCFLYSPSLSLSFFVSRPQFLSSSLALSLFYFVEIFVIITVGVVRIRPSYLSQALHIQNAYVINSIKKFHPKIKRQIENRSKSNGKNGKMWESEKSGLPTTLKKIIMPTRRRRQRHNNASDSIDDNTTTTTTTAKTGVTRQTKHSLPLWRSTPDAAAEWEKEKRNRAHTHTHEGIP